MLQNIDDQILLARGLLAPFCKVPSLPIEDQKEALAKCRKELLLAIGANEFCFDIGRELMDFAGFVKDAPAFIDAAMMTCSTNMRRTNKEIAIIRRDVDGLEARA